MFTLLQKLHRIDLLSIKGVLRLLQAVMTTGINLMALLRLAAQLHPQRMAVTDDNERLSYKELAHRSEYLAKALQAEFGIKGGQKIAIACRNHAAAIQSIFAASRLGAHVFLLNPDMSDDQILALEDRHHFDFYIHEEYKDVFRNAKLINKSIPAYHADDNSISRLISESKHSRHQLKKVKTGNIVVLTGGTTGQPKAASRKPSVFAFLPPFVALLTEVHLDRYRSVYIPTPIYHGFGLAALFIGTILGLEMFFTARFDAARGCTLVETNNVEGVVVVPIMLDRMLKQEEKALSPLKCIITGGALLKPALAQKTLETLGPILFNLYGTSEAGFCIMGKPELLAKKPQAVGQPIWGVRCQIADKSGQEVKQGAIGQLNIRAAWAITQKSWVPTGDIAYRDEDGDIFLCGRSDDMIVSGGENVYPIELEHVLSQHPDLEAVAVVGIPDEEFGQRLKAVVVVKADVVPDTAMIKDWLKPRVSRHQMPAKIEFRDALPYTALGKLDKKVLRGDKAT